MSMRKSPDATGFTPTGEQAAIIAHEPVSDLLVEAGAGTGKTTALKAYARQWNDRPGIYIAFNRAIADASKGQFPRNIEVMTAHSYAYRSRGMQKYKSRIIPKIRRNHIRDMNLALDHPHLPRERMVAAITDAITNFCNDSTQALEPRHCGLGTVPTNIANDIITKVIGPAVGEFLYYENGHLPITHDIYLKRTQLEGGMQGKFEYVMVDEAQDLSPVLLSLVKNTNLPTIYIGDRFQSIYAFRGAIDALSQIEAKKLNLTQSWRFGQDVAEVANFILSRVTRPPEWKLQGRPGHDTQVLPYNGNAPARSFLLSRTNSRLFEGLVNLTNKTFHVVGGFESISTQVSSALALSRGDRSNIREPLIMSYSHWDDMVSDADDSDPEVKRLVKIVKDYGDTIPGILERLNKLYKPNMHDADIIMSTAHKAKGLESSCVVVLDDFNTPNELREQYEMRELDPTSYNQELHLLYVALTRGIDRMMVAPGLYHEIMTEMRKAK